MTQYDKQLNNPKQPSRQARLESTGAERLTLANAGPIQMGFWVPNRVWATAKFLVPLRNLIAEKKKAGTLTPMRAEIIEFKTWVTHNSVYRMWVNSMIEQSNAYVATLDEATKEQIKDTDGDALWIAGYDSFFEILNEIISTSSSFNTTAQVGTPMNAFLAVSMGTEAGVALFHDTTFNQQFKKVLNAWNAFLKSSASSTSWTSTTRKKRARGSPRRPMRPGSGRRWSMTRTCPATASIPGTRFSSAGSCPARGRSRAIR